MVSVLVVLHVDVIWFWYGYGYGRMVQIVNSTLCVQQIRCIAGNQCIQIFKVTQII